jgi:hypothetical protein
MIKVSHLVLLILVLSTQSAFAGSDWDPGVAPLLANADAVASLPCSSAISASGSPTGNTLPILTWFFGYRDGLAALAKIDYRSTP